MAYWGFDVRYKLATVAPIDSKRLLQLTNVACWRLGYGQEIRLSSSSEKPFQVDKQKMPVMQQSMLAVNS